MRNRNQQKYFPKVGDIFNRLTIIEIISPTEDLPETRYKCKCQCGTIKNYKIYGLYSGKTKSCGCYNKEKAQKLGYNNKLKEGNSTENNLISVYRYAAKRRNLDCTLSKSDFHSLFLSKCHYCGKEPYRIAYRKQCRNTFTYNGIDRLDNKIGYNLDNCVSCCTTCNKAKMSMAVGEFKEWIISIYNNFIVNKGEFKP